MLFLLKNGVPYDTYMKWSRARRVAAVVTLREMDGLKYDWSSGQYAVMD